MGTPQLVGSRRSELLAAAFRRVSPQVGNERPPPVGPIAARLRPLTAAVAFRVMPQIAILDGERTVSADAVIVGDSVLVDANDFEAATGWRLKPEGLCRGDVCVPTRAHPDVVVDGRIDAAKAAGLMGRSVVVDPLAQVVAYGPSAVAVAEQLADRRAPNFTLAQLDGTPFSLAAIGRKKKVLVTWASW